MPRHCPYINCPLKCTSITIHNARYASIKEDYPEGTTKSSTKSSITKHKKSPRINYEVAIKLGLI